MTDQVAGTTPETLSSSSVHLLLQLFADGADGDSLVTALRWGPFAGLPVDAISLYSVHWPEACLRLRGAFNWTERFRKEFGVNPLNDSHPGGETTLTGETIWLDLPALAQRYPLVASLAARYPFYADGQAISLPIVSRGIVTGNLFVNLTESIEQSAQILGVFAEVQSFFAAWLLLQESIASEPPPPPGKTRLALTEREREVLRLLENGATNQSIARALGYSEATVRGDLSRLFGLVGARGRRDVVARARELGLYRDQ